MSYFWSLCNNSLELKFLEFLKETLLMIQTHRTVVVNLVWTATDSQNWPLSKQIRWQIQREYLS